MPAIGMIATGQGHVEAEVVIAAQHDDRMRRIFVPSERIENIQAALADVVTWRSVVRSDNDHTFLNVMN